MGSWPVEHRDCAFPFLQVAVNVGDFGVQETVCLCPDLVRSAVVYPQGLGTAPNINTELFPGKRLLEDALAQVAREKESVGTATGDGSQESQLGDAHVLGLVHHNEVEGRVASFRNMSSQLSEHFGLGQQPLFSQARPDPLEYRPQ